MRLRLTPDSSLVSAASRALPAEDYRRARDRRRRPQGGHRDGRAGASACRARAHRRHDRLARRSRRGTPSPPARRSPWSRTRSSRCRCRRWIRASPRSSRSAIRRRPISIASPSWRRRGVSTQTQLDQAKTNLDVAERNLTAMRTDRSVIAQQASEGAVLAPGAGRVLNVPVSRRSASSCRARRSPRSPRINTSCAWNCPSGTPAFMRAGRCGAHRLAGLAGRRRRPTRARAACASSIPRSRAAASSPTSRSRASATISSASARASTSTRERGGRSSFPPPTSTAAPA